MAGQTYLETRQRLAVKDQLANRFPGALQVSALTGDLGAALHYLADSTSGALQSGGTDRYSFSVRPTEVRATAGQAVLLGVVVEATSGTLAPGP